MVIKSKNIVSHALLCIILFGTNQVNSEIATKNSVPQKIEISDLKPGDSINMDNIEATFKNNNIKKPLFNKKIAVSRIFNPSKNLFINTDFDNLNKKSSRVEQVNSLILNENQFLEIVGIDEKRKLFNGTFLIRFNNIPNLENYANLNDLVFVKSLSDINVGVFKVKNILDIQIKLDNLQEDSNIISIDLDTIDPTIKLK